MSSNSRDLSRGGDHARGRGRIQRESWSAVVFAGGLATTHAHSGRSPRSPAYVRSWAKMVGITDPETAERVFRPENDYVRGNTIGLLDMCCVFADEPMFTRPEALH